MTNNLINETSPYLLQHKDNPVNWFAWNNNTINLAKQKNMPVLLSIGYSSCHWCHVMAHESFEDPIIASIMNNNFINIKVDREERPDIDALYQTSLSLMGPQGGWPLTMFLDISLKPFWGGTYFPNIRKHGLPSFRDVLEHVAKIYKNNNQQVLNNSNAITEALIKINSSSAHSDYSLSDVRQIKNTVYKMFDNNYGGLSGAPKFPMCPLLKYFTLISSKYSDDNLRCVAIVEKTIKAISVGGIFDHVGGGFSRYSTDEYWLVPHFEKMLYDNAQLIEVLSILHLIKPSYLYKSRVFKTFDWLLDEMLAVSDGYHAYYSAIDADSEGVEGAYYVWDIKLIEETLGLDSKNFIKEYGAEIGGNWENSNILNRINKLSEKEFAYEKSDKNINSLKKLLAKRKTRVAPLIDKKILTDSNSMLICGFLRAFVAFGEQKFYEEANRVFLYIKNKHIISGELYHSSCENVLGAKGNLDDYANFIKACFLLYEIDGDLSKLKLAKKLLEVVESAFFDSTLSDFTLANKNSDDLFIKTKSSVDNATQSGSGIMIENLYRSYYFFGNIRHFQLIDTLIKNIWIKIKSNPISYMGYVYGSNLQLECFHFVVLIKNDEFGSLIKERLLKLAPFIFLTFVDDAKNIPKNSPAFGKKNINKGTTVYVCSGFVCSAPITCIEEINNWINKNTVIGK